MGKSAWIPSVPLVLHAANIPLCGIFVAPRRFCQKTFWCGCPLFHNKVKNISKCIEWKIVQIDMTFYFVSFLCCQIGLLRQSIKRGTPIGGRPQTSTDRPLLLSTAALPPKGVPLLESPPPYLPRHYFGSSWCGLRRIGVYIAALFWVEGILQLFLLSFFPSTTI